MKSELFLNTKLVLLVSDKLITFSIIKDKINNKYIFIFRISWIKKKKLCENKFYRRKKPAHRKILILFTIVSFYDLLFVNLHCFLGFTPSSMTDSWPVKLSNVIT